MKSSICFSFLLLITSCASNRHDLMRGTVALKIDETHGIACLEPKKAKVGTKMRFMNNDCSRPRLPDSRAACSLVESGEIEITKILNEHYAEFKMVSGKSFNEGSIIR